MQHIIKKQIISLGIENRLDAFRIQQQVSNYYFEKIAPLLEDAFNAISGEDEIISIDNLEIDLGTLTVKEIEKGNLDKRILKNIAEQLIHLKRGGTHGIKVIKKTSLLSFSEQWIFYMQHGYLSWNVLEINDDWYHKTLEAFASETTAINNLRVLITGHPDAVRRIVFQNPVSFLKSLVETLTAENQDALPGIINEIAAIISADNQNRNHNTSALKNEASQQLWMQVLQLAISETKLKSSKFAGLLSGNNFSIQQLNSEKAKQFLLNNKTDTGLVKQIIKEKERKETKKDKKVSTDEDKTELNEDEIYVFNAGIVLLHPFLNRFFKNLRLIEDNGFISAPFQLKALYLLHYLATGNIHPKEHELTIAKILCAFPLESPVDNLAEITKEELQEADSMIAFAIAQWEILKDTSADGLREGFLQRKGKLYTKNGILNLQVEQRAIDMLLDHLPWNLSIIKLPWMKEILKVEWR